LVLKERTDLKGDAQSRLSATPSGGSDHDGIRQRPADADVQPRRDRFVRKMRRINAGSTYRAQADGPKQPDGDRVPLPTSPKRVGRCKDVSFVENCISAGRFPRGRRPDRKAREAFPGRHYLASALSQFRYADGIPPYLPAFTARPAS
jgi:hypothetical protein